MRGASSGWKPDLRCWRIRECLSAACCATSKPGRSNARCGEGTNKQHVPSPKVIDHRLAGSAPARAGKGVAARESDVLPDFHAVEGGVPVRVELVLNLGPVMGGATDWCVFVQSLRILRRWSSPNPRLAKAALRRSSDGRRHRGATP